jgi:hypothetical protein
MSPGPDLLERVEATLVAEPSPAIFLWRPADVGLAPGQDDGQRAAPPPGSRSLSLAVPAARRRRARGATLSLRQVTGHCVPLAEILQKLVALPMSQSASPGHSRSIAVWSAAAKLAVELVAGHDVAPWIDDHNGEARGRWRADLGPRQRARAAALARALPMSARAWPGAAPPRARPRVMAAWPALRLFLDAAVDALVRPHASSHAANAWTSRLAAALGPGSGRIDVRALVDDRLPELVRQWAAPGVGDAAEAPIRLGLRLELPREDDRGRWPLNLVAQAADDPSLQVEVGDLWESRGTAAGALLELIANAQEAVLLEIDRACRLWPALDPCLDAAAPGAIELRPEQVVELVSEAAPLLDSAGISLRVPPELSIAGRQRLRARLRGPRPRRVPRRRHGPRQDDAAPVAPTSVVGNWEREIARFAPALGSCATTARRGSAAMFPAARHAGRVTTYGLLRRDAGAAARASTGPSSRSTRRRTSRTPRRRQQGRPCAARGHRFALTGTPVENRLAELWSILDFANPGLLGRSRPSARLRLPIERYGDPTRRERLRARGARSSCAGSRPTRPSSPTCPRSTRPKVVSASRASRRRSTRRRRRELGDRVARPRASSAGARCSRCSPRSSRSATTRRSTSASGGRCRGRSGKLARSDRDARGGVAEGDPALVFTQFREMGDLLVRAPRQPRPARSCSSTAAPRAARDEMVAASRRSRRGPPLFVLSLKAGGTGLNLTRASPRLPLDRWWNPAVEDQATDRAYRIGQTRRAGPQARLRGHRRGEDRPPARAQARARLEGRRRGRDSGSPSSEASCRPKSVRRSTPPAARSSRPTPPISGRPVPARTGPTPASTWRQSTTCWRQPSTPTPS